MITSYIFGAMDVDIDLQHTTADTQKLKLRVSAER
jgi:hypothetical protein